MHMKSTGLLLALFSLQRTTSRHCNVLAPSMALAALPSSPKSTHAGSQPDGCKPGVHMAHDNDKYIISL